MELDRVLHRRLEAVSLVGQDVEQDRAFHRLDPLEIAAEHLEVVAVDRPEVDETQLFEEHPVVERGLDRRPSLLEPAVDVLADQGDIGQQPLDPLVPVVEGAGHPCAVEVFGQSADPRANRHLVVVEDHQHLLLQPAGMIERLEDDAGGEVPSPMTATEWRSGLPAISSPTFSPRAVEGAQPACPVMNRSNGLSVGFG